MRKCGPFFEAWHICAGLVDAYIEGCLFVIASTAKQSSRVQMDWILLRVLACGTSAGASYGCLGILICCVWQHGGVQESCPWCVLAGWSMMLGLECTLVLVALNSIRKC
jgi:hypothetical protein